MENVSRPRKNADEFARFYGRLSERSMSPLWEVIRNVITPEPITPVKPAHWRFQDVRPLLFEAFKLQLVDLCRRNFSRRQVHIARFPHLLLVGRNRRQLQPQLVAIHSPQHLVLGNKIAGLHETLFEDPGEGRCNEAALSRLRGAIAADAVGQPRHQDEADQDKDGPRHPAP